jgi:dTDP-glucose 4,6-dehydratase
MRVLVAGGAGFVGFHLVRRLLDRGHGVFIVDSLITGRRSNLVELARVAPPGRLDVLEADICTMTLPEPRFDAVLHLASPASPVDYQRHPLETLEAGSTGTRRLLELARRDGARFLLASTSEVYGDPQVHPQPESYWGRVNPVGPRSCYDEAKRYAEALTSAHARHLGVLVRIVRIFNTYGPRMRLDDGRVIPTFIRQALCGEPLTVFGDGSQTRSYCYVDDLVEGLEALLWSDVEGPVNLGNDEEHAVLATARRIVELTGNRSPIVLHPLPADDPRIRRPDLTRARTELGWEPRVRFEDGLGRTIEDLARRIRREGAAGVAHGIAWTGARATSRDVARPATSAPPRIEGHWPLPRKWLL